jgi:hypothetical protein
MMYFNLGWVGWDTVLPAGFPGMEESSQSNVILGHHPVQHVLVPVGVLDGQLVEFHQLFFDQNKLNQKITIFSALSRGPEHVQLLKLSADYLHLQFHHLN